MSTLSVVPSIQSHPHTMYQGLQQVFRPVRGLGVNAVNLTRTYASVPKKFFPDEPTLPEMKTSELPGPKSRKLSGQMSRWQDGR